MRDTQCHVITYLKDGPTLNIKISSKEFDRLYSEEDSEVFETNFERIPGIQLVLMMMNVQSQICLYVSTQRFHQVLNAKTCQNTAYTNRTQQQNTTIE